MPIDTQQKRRAALLGAVLPPADATIDKTDRGIAADIYGLYAEVPVAPPAGRSGLLPGGRRKGLATRDRPTTATLAGVPLLATEEISWSIREGVAPVIQVFPIRPIDKPKLEAISSQPVVLKLSGPRGEITFSRLWIIDFPPGANKELAAVRVADRRWWWPYRHVLQRFNIRRRIGVKRAFDQVAPIEAFPVVPEIAYAPYSMNRGKKWEAHEVVSEVLAECVFAEPHTGTVGKPKVSNIFQNIPIDNLEIDDAADQALARVLEFIPAAGLFITPDGDIVVYHKWDRAEESIAFPLGDEIAGGGHIALAFQHLKRPREIRVLFSYEAEVRFDFKEQSGTTVVPRSEDFKEKSRLLDNVLAVPDFFLLVEGFMQAQGTWITIDQALASWPVNVNFGERLSHAHLRRAMLPYVDMYSALADAGKLEPDADWASRVAALEEHYRTTFRIPQRWVDRILTLKPYRVSTINQMTATRAPAIAYCDYAILMSLRAFRGAGGAQRANAYPVANVKGYPPNDVIDRSESRPAPAFVEVVDSDQGIIRLDFQLDPARSLKGYIPGNIENAGMPTGAITVAQREARPVVFDGIPEPGKFPQLEADHKMAVILTAVPSAPNSAAQLFAFSVRNTDQALLNLLPARIQEATRRASGPPLDVRVPPNVETARVAWRDNRSDEIARLFGVNNDDDPRAVNVESLIINLRGNAVVPGEGGAGLEEIAIAIAAKIYASYGDHMQGVASFDLAPRAVPAGALEEVAFAIDPEGKAVTILKMADKLPDVSLFSFMDDGTRAVIMRLAQE